MILGGTVSRARNILRKSTFAFLSYRQRLRNPPRADLKLVDLIFRVPKLLQDPRQLTLIRRRFLAPADSIVHLGRSTPTPLESPQNPKGIKRTDCGKRGSGGKGGREPADENLDVAI
jgi:hypothetical protein